MPKVDRKLLEEIRGVTRLAIDGSLGVTGAVEAMHRTIERVAFPLGPAGETRTRGLTGFVYACVRGGMTLTGRGLDAGLSTLAELVPAAGEAADGAEAAPPEGREAFVSALNGVWGDHLAATGNPLAIPLVLRHRGRAIDLDAPGAWWAAHGEGAASPHLLVLVHGLCMSDGQWRWKGHHHGEALAAAHGLTSVGVRYNTGRAIADNGRALADALEALVARWPVRVERVVLLGHSMGGLVARSAAHVAEQEGHGWRQALDSLITLGTPHLGAPLERGGRGIDLVLSWSPYSAPIGALTERRSAGIRDLSHGTVAPGPGRRVPLPEGVRCYAVAGHRGERRTALADRLVGDGVVPVQSALGDHADPARALAFPEAHRVVLPGHDHLALLASPDVYERLHVWLSGR